MSADTLVFDMSSQSEGSPSVFVRKDWLSILDNQNQNYQGNQSVIDTSQLANSNKYMNYREAYLVCPLWLTMTGVGTSGANTGFNPATASSSADFAVGLKNWYGSIVHSFTLDYNGTTIIQQTPYIGLWNTFKLMTTLSYNDLITQSGQIGFYPDTPLAWTYAAGAGGASGRNVCNNVNGFAGVAVSGAFSSAKSFNEGFLQRQLAWNYDPEGLTGTEANSAAFSTLLGAAGLTAIYKSYIANKVNQTANTQAGAGVFQACITSVIYLKHLASFFERVPLLKGVFMKMTLNLNQGSVSYTATPTFGTTNATTGAVGEIAAASNEVLTITALTTGSIQAGMSFLAPLGGNAGQPYVIVRQLTGVSGQLGTYLISPPSVDVAGAPLALASGAIQILSSSSVPAVAFTNVVSTSPLGGVQPIMIASASGGGGFANGIASGGARCYLTTTNAIVSVSVGNRCLNTTQTSTTGVVASPLGGSIILNVPAYTFNPVFESSYLSSPVKKIVYTDVYQYQIVNTINPNQNFNNLISNGIANIKSVLCMPFFSVPTAASGNMTIAPIQSPFDPAGGGATSPLSLFTQFNIQISGQNAIYNTERYSYEQFLNQLYGQNSVNGGLTDGMTSGLIDQKAFESEYCYYYVNCGRMLPVEEAVPKSVSVLGQSVNLQPMDLFIFVEYGVEISLDILTGARI